MPIHNNVKNILLFANDTLKKKICQPDLKTMTDKFKKTVYGINLSSTINYSKCVICYCDYGAQIKGIIVHTVRLFTRNKLLLEKYQHIYVLSFIYVIYI